ncbi:hypothetical protein ACFPRL_01820 [Pseudoclavibacter helvolus]
MRHHASSSKNAPQHARIGAVSGAASRLTVCQRKISLPSWSSTATRLPSGRSSPCRSIAS